MQCSALHLHNDLAGTERDEKSAGCRSKQVIAKGEKNEVDELGHFYCGFGC